MTYVPIQVHNDWIVSKPVIAASMAPEPAVSCDKIMFISMSGMTVVYHSINMINLITNLINSSRINYFPPSTIFHKLVVQLCIKLKY